MMDAQWPADAKRAGATWIIENDGTRELLAAHVEALWRAIQTRLSGTGST
jgi:dephospho-CoA kinase